MKFNNFLYRLSKRNCSGRPILTTTSRLLRLNWSIPQLQVRVCDFISHINLSCQFSLQFLLSFSVPLLSFSDQSIGFFLSWPEVHSVSSALIGLSHFSDRFHENQRLDHKIRLNLSLLWQTSLIFVSESNKPHFLSPSLQANKLLEILGEHSKHVKTLDCSLWFTNFFCSTNIPLGLLASNLVIESVV